MGLSDYVEYTHDQLSIDSRLKDAIELMKDEDENHVILFDGQSVQGILTLKDIIKLYAQGVLENELAIDHAIYPIVTIHDDRPIDMAIEMMIDHEIRRIVLLDHEERYKGTLTYSDILRYFESVVHSCSHLSQTLHYRNKAVIVKDTATIADAIKIMSEMHREVLLVEGDDSSILGTISEKNILQLIRQKKSVSEIISPYTISKLISISGDDSIAKAASMMRENHLHHIIVESEDIHILNEKDLVLSYNTPLEVKLEAKLRDAKATYNLLGLAFCEVIDLGAKQIIKWLNAEAMMTFNVKIDDPVSKLIGEENWDRLIKNFYLYRGIDKEKIEINGRIYELTLMEAELNSQPFMKLFLKDIDDLIRLNEQLATSLQHTLELEKEKNKLYLDVASVMCLALDRLGNIVMLNPKGCEVLETTKEEALGENWFDKFVHTNQRDEAKKLFMEIIEGKEKIVEFYNNSVITALGNKRMISWHNALMKDDDGTIIGTFSSGEDITIIQENQERLERITHYDTLTNLPNRILLNARLDHSIKRAQRDGKKIIVLYIDLDNFKDINESFGYIVGDSVIQQVALKMGMMIRNEDTISRIGGDEFIILLEQINEVNECERSLQSIIELFREPIFTLSGELQMSASIGISVYPDDGEDGETLLKHADIALRRAKESGTGEYSFYTQEMSIQLLERVLMERELRRSVEEKEFVVYYQPQVDLISGKLIGAEALVRWKHPTLGIVRPDLFIPLAEATNLIVPIGEEVIAQSCTTVKRWKDAGLFSGRVSINVSGKQFVRSDIVAVIEHIIKESGLDYQSVELEITESVLMGTPQELETKLSQLKSLGIKIAIDDFGTGYSSLSYLKVFPIDKLKIDQSFVRGIGNNEKDNTIVKAIIAMADALGFTTIAEGIEEEQQSDILKDLGCQEGQGYMYARPLDEKAFEIYLRDQKEIISE